MASLKYIIASNLWKSYNFITIINIHLVAMVLNIIVQC